MGTTRQLPRSQRHKSILRGAAKAFAQGGFAATSMEDIAAASGITKLIVYRHFDSKQELYQAVLQRVSERLGEEFRSGFEQGRDDITARALLTVAREDPEGFSLLWRHAIREPQFAAYAHEYREGSVKRVQERLQEAGVQPRMARWAAETLVSYGVESVLHWLDVGCKSLDDEFVAMSSRGLKSIFAAFSQSG